MSVSRSVQERPVVAVPARPRRFARPVSAPLRPSTAKITIVQPARSTSGPRADAAPLDWPLERWTGPVYVLSQGRPVRRTGVQRAAMLVVTLILGSLMMLVGAGPLAIIGGVICAATLLIGLPWPRRWFENALTPAMAVRTTAPSARREG